MAKEIKKIPVAHQAQAAIVINGLTRKYDMKQDTTRHQLQVANERYAAYYDPAEGVVKLEAIHPATTEEEIREFLINFPTFF